jgi:serine/threonine-protein kinase RsbW
VRLALRPDPAGVRRLLEELRRRWRAARVDEALADRAELVLAEMLNNVLEHALRGRAAGRVEVECVPVSGGLALRVRDNGRPMPRGQLPPGLMPMLPAERGALPEGGFGWPLIHALAEDLRYSRGTGENCLTALVPQAAAGLGRACG